MDPDVNDASTSSAASASAPADDHPLAVLKKSLTLSATVILPDNKAEYDIERSTYALNHCHSPSLIIVCASTSDVVQAVKYCRSTGQDFTVAGGMCLYCTVLFLLH
jgi:hypothetical protein